MPAIASSSATLLQKLEIRQPENGIARNVAEARKVAKEIGYPVLVRPSFVLGGRAMEIVSDEQQLNYYMAHAVEAVGDSPILIDKFLDAAIECDVDCLADYDPAGGSDDPARQSSSASWSTSRKRAFTAATAPASCPHILSKPQIIERLKQQTRALAKAPARARSDERAVRDQGWARST